ncbi:MAG: ferredoxin--NADP reductase [Planctomycetota bacterium]
MPNWINAEVVNKKVWTEGLFTIRIRADGVQPFKPGQFLHLAMPENPGDDLVADESKRINRPYSVASPHGAEIEFFIVVVPEGKLTPKLWDLKVGDQLEVSDAGSGRFTLEKSPPAKSLWLVATGTGLAPYIAMLRTEEPWSSYEKIIVVHGVRFAADLAYTEELKAYEDRYPGRFYLVQSLTRETADGVLHGRIPQLFENREVESETGIDCMADDSTVLLCGNPAMLDSMEEVLARRDMKKHRSKSPGQIVLERYW